MIRRASAWRADAEVQQAEERESILFCWTMATAREEHESREQEFL